MKTETSGPEAVTIDQLTEWAVTIGSREFAQAVYGRPGERDGGYCLGKYHEMQRNFVNWYGSLDLVNRDRAVSSILRHTVER